MLMRYEYVVAINPNFNATVAAKPEVIEGVAITMEVKANIKIYVAARCGYESLNYPAFAQTAAVLRNAGHEVVPPPE